MNQVLMLAVGLLQDPRELRGLLNSSYEVFRNTLSHSKRTVDGLSS